MGTGVHVICSCLPGTRPLPVGQGVGVAAGKSHRPIGFGPARLRKLPTHATAHKHNRLIGYQLKTNEHISRPPQLGPPETGIGVQSREHVTHTHTHTLARARVFGYGAHSERKRGNSRAHKGEGAKRSQSGERFVRCLASETTTKPGRANGHSAGLLRAPPAAGTLGSRNTAAGLKGERPGTRPWASRRQEESAARRQAAPRPDWARRRIGFEPFPIITTNDAKTIMKIIIMHERAKRWRKRSGIKTPHSAQL